MLTWLSSPLLGRFVTWEQRNQKGTFAISFLFLSNKKTPFFCFSSLGCPLPSWGGL
jgi:hypothetical protein